MRNVILFVLNTLCLSVLVPPIELFAQTLMLRVRKDDSHVGFSITKWAVFKEEGRFRDFDGTIEFDPQDPSHLKVDFTIQAASIDSRNDDRDRALRSDEFFHVSRYPTLTFRSINARSLDKSNIAVEGDLTIRGVTKRVTIPVRILGVNQTGRELGTLVGFEATLTLDRGDFGVGERWAIISREATIHLLIGAGTAPRTASR